MLRLPAVALILLAAAEIAVIIVVAHLIGVAFTVLALVASTAVGLWVTRAQGRRAWEALRAAAAGGEPAGRELGDAALIFAGGALIAIPGFITDVLGLCAVAPFTRPAVRRLVGAYLLRRAAATGARMDPGAPAGTGPQPPRRIIRGEVIEKDPTADPVPNPRSGSSAEPALRRPGGRGAPPR